MPRGKSREEPRKTGGCVPEKRPPVPAPCSNISGPHQAAKEVGGLKETLCRIYKRKKRRKMASLYIGQTGKEMYGSTFLPK